MTLAQPSSGFRVTGRGVLVAMVLFFGIVVGVDVLFATLAYSTFSGEAAKDPYEAGLVFNRTLAQRRAEAALGWQASVTSDAGGVTLYFSDRDSHPIDGLTLTANLVRPATEMGSKPVRFVNIGGGAYRASLDALHGGWDLNVVARDAENHPFEVSHRLILP